MKTPKKKTPKKPKNWIQQNVAGMLAVGALVIPMGLSAYVAYHRPNSTMAQIAPPPKTTVGQYLASRFSHYNRHLGQSVEYLKPLQHTAEQTTPNATGWGLSAMALNSLMMNQLNLGQLTDGVQTAQALHTAHAGVFDKQGVQDYLAYGYRLSPLLVLATHAVAQGHYDNVADLLAKKTGSALLDRISYVFLKSWALAGAGDWQGGVKTLKPHFASIEIGNLAKLHASYMAQSAGDYKRAYAVLADIKRPSADVYAQKLWLLAQLKKWQQGRDVLATMQKLGVPVDPALMDSVMNKTAPPAVNVPSAPLQIGAVFLEFSHSLSASSPELALLYGQLSRMVAPDDSPEMVAYLASLLGNMGALTDATNHLKSALKKQGADSLPITIGLMDLYEKQGDYDNALNILESLDKTYGCDPAIWESKGDIFAQQERPKNARHAYTTAINCLDDTTDPSAWILYFKRADTHSHDKNWDAMEPDLLYAQNLSPKNSVLLNYLGYTWIEWGKNTDKALDLIKKSLALNPNSGATIDSLGWAYYKLGRYTDAVPTLEKSAMLETDPVIADHLGDAYWQVGRKREARYQWQRVVDLYAHNDQATHVVQSARKKLKQGLAED